jgi:hypothetical protein
MKDAALVYDRQNTSVGTRIVGPQHRAKQLARKCPRFLAALYRSLLEPRGIFGREFDLKSHGIIFLPRTA